MAIPRPLLALPLVVLGAAVPGLADHEPFPARPNLVGMEQVTFDRDVITIRQGQQIQFVNNSNFLHVIAPGDRARVSDARRCAVVRPRRRAVDAAWRPVRHRRRGTTPAPTT